MDSEDQLQLSQGSMAGSHPQSVEPSPYPHNIFIHLSNLNIILPSMGQVGSPFNFPTKIAYAILISLIRATYLLYLRSEPLDGVHASDELGTGRDGTKADACARVQFPLFRISSGSSNKYDPRMWNRCRFLLVFQW
jgi:hypothetical protein